MVTALPQIRAGKLRAIAVTGAKRFELLPDVPTIAETVPGYEAATWGGVGAPRGTPPEIVERLNRDINAGLANPAVRARLLELGTLPMILSAARVRRLCGGRGREVEQGGEGGRHQAGVMRAESG